ncbi:MAG: hypothetical protein ACFFFT_13655 [Candidatus Thorarchaeota archaeon]
MENRSSLFGIIAIIIGASGLGIGAYSIVNFQTVEGPQGIPGEDGQDVLGDIIIGILDPDDGETVSGNITIRVMVWASSNYSLSILCNGLEIGSSLSVEWNTTLVPDGMYNISVIAIDESNNIDKDEVMIIIENNPPQVPQGGSVFIRWGSKTAPAGTTLIYWGIGCAGSPSHAGDPSDPFVLTYDPPPDFVWYDDSNANEGIYPLRLWGNLHGPLEMYMGYGVYAAVCYAPGPTVILWGALIPPPGWRVLYRGYAMGSYYSSANGINPICVECDNFEGIPDIGGSYVDLWGLEISGGGQCPPYAYDREITCAVIMLDS